MTNRLAFFICQELIKLTSLTSVAKVANVSVSTVIRIFNHVNYGTPTLPKVLCIDEFKGNAETGKYQCRELAKWIQNAESSGIPEFEKCAQNTCNSIHLNHNTKIRLKIVMERDLRKSHPKY